jgi:hypothetical protein
MMQTEKQLQEPATIQEAPPSLVEEILLETKARQHLGLFDLDRAAEQAKQRVEAHRVLMHAAIAATEPIHWLWFKDQQGNLRGRFNYAGAARIARVFGITVAAKGPVKIIDANGKKTAEVWGMASSIVLGITYDNIRAYRVQGEDFLGRATAVVGENDWIQSTQTALISKGVRILSGLVTVSPRELAEVWSITEDEVVKGGAMGHGFSTQERKAAGQNAGPSKLATDPQKKLLYAKAGARAKALPQAEVDGEMILREAIAQICGVEATIDTVTMDQVNRLIPFIDSWGAQS